MGKFCSGCGKEILVGNKCPDCARAEQERWESESYANKIDYKKLTIVSCLVVTVLILLASCALTRDVSEFNDNNETNSNYYLPSNESNDSNEYNNSSSNIPDYKTESTKESYTTTTPGAKATDFEIIGGSEGVYIISPKNFGAICPYCGYDGGALGSSFIWSKVSNYRAGETVSIPGAAMCASNFQGGCRQTYNYTVTVQFK